MDDRYVACNEDNACLGVIACNRILRVPELLVDPCPDLLVELRAAGPWLPGVGVADAVFGIERQPAVLCESVGGRSEQREKKQMFQDKVLNGTGQI